MRLDKGQIEVIDEKMAMVLRKKTPDERIRIGFSIWESAYKMLKSHLKASHPGWGSKRLNLEVARRLSNGAI
jgi:hypothetical protein